MAGDKEGYPGLQERTATSAAEDERWVSLTLQGQQEAFRWIVEKYTPVFYPLIRRMRYDWNAESVEDALQEIFLLIYRALPSYRSGRPFFTWAYTIAINYLRSQQRKVRSNKIPLHIPYDDEIASLQGSRSFTSPEEALIANEADHMLFRALQELRKHYREVFVLRMLQKLSVTETARILHLPEGTVKTFLHRAQKQLRSWLTDHQWNPKE